MIVIVHRTCLHSRQQSLCILQSTFAASTAGMFVYTTVHLCCLQCRHVRVYYSPPLLPPVQACSCILQSTFAASSAGMFVQSTFAASSAGMFVYTTVHLCCLQCRHVCTVHLCCLQCRHVRTVRPIDDIHSCNRKPLSYAPTVCSVAHRK